MRRSVCKHHTSRALVTPIQFFITKIILERGLAPSLLSYAA